MLFVLFAHSAPGTNRVQGGYTNGRNSSPLSPHLMRTGANLLYESSRIDWRGSRGQKTSKMIKIREIRPECVGVWGAKPPVDNQQKKEVYI